MKPVKVEKKIIGMTVYLANNEEQIKDGDYYIYKFIGEPETAWQFARCKDGVLPKCGRMKVVAANLVLRDLPLLTFEWAEMIIKSNKTRFNITWSQENIVNSIDVIKDIPYSLSIGPKAEESDTDHAGPGLWLLSNGVIVFKPAFNPEYIVVETGEVYHGPSCDCISIILNTRPVNL